LKVEDLYPTVATGGSAASQYLYFVAMAIYPLWFEDNISRSGHKIYKELLQNLAGVNISV
jgi:hypothetical protein